MMHGHTYIKVQLSTTHVSEVYQVFIVSRQQLT